MITNVAPLHKSQHKRQDGNLLSFNRKILRIAGIIPAGNLPESPRKKNLFTLFLILWYCLFILLYIGQILAVCHFWGNMEVTTFALISVLGATMAQLEGTYTILYSSSILKLLDFLDCNVYSKMEGMDINKIQRQIMESAKIKAKRLSIIMMVWSDVMMTCWIIFPFTRKYLREHKNETNLTVVQYDDKWKDFCFIIWAPFDITVTPYYEITYVCQIIMFVITTTYWKSVQTTIMSLIIYISAHFKILENLLSEMKTSFSTVSENGETLVQSNKHLTNNAGPFTTHHSVKQIGTGEPKQERLSMDRLENNEFKNEEQNLQDFTASFVNYHEAVIEFVRRVNKIFGPMLFISFLASQLMLCLGLFQMALTENDCTFVTNIVTCIAIMTPQFIFCWYGNEVIENSQSLKQAAFESSLVQSSREFNNFILMIMKNTQKPLQFSGLGFYTLSLEEFTKAMNGAYAYFNILKNIHSDHEFKDT